ncbi:IS3 family transposase [Chryseobacterium sp. JUb7]|nr:IS3 family transposase [Chryseobacterium sp. JUb7]MCS3531163.1 putative transposase [Chryseobacterium sp. JUb7]
MVSKKDVLSFNKQCNALGLNRSTLYYRKKDKSEQDKAIELFMQEQYVRTPFYGYRKLTVLLREAGFQINSKRVRRLMKVINWRTIYREPSTTVVNKAHKKYPYLLKGLEIDRKNQVWATDITYIPMKKGFMYLSAIIDLKTRYVLNWDISNTMSAEWCTDLLKETLHMHGKPEIFNTDQGSQYTSDLHTKELLDNDISISMDGKGRALDNIFVERLWRSVKYENVYLQAYDSPRSLRAGLRSYFEFYNQERFHQGINYNTPQSMYLQADAA